MQQLHVVGFTTDHKGLILGTRRGFEEGSFVISLDRAFVEQIEELLRLQAGESGGDPGSSAAGNGGTGMLRRPKVQSRLTPRQVQAMLRTGRSVSEVAEEAGMSEEWVGRFAPPVMAEQERVVERATSLTYSKPRLGPSTQPLGESVIWNLAEKGIVLSGLAVEDAWTAFQQPEGAWVVRVSYLAERRRQHADWSVDMALGEVRALNRLGNELGYVEPGRRRPAALPPPTPVSASAQRAAAAPSRPPPPAPRPARPSGRLSLLSNTAPPPRSSGAAPSAPAPRPARTAPAPPPEPPADGPGSGDKAPSDRLRGSETPAPDRSGGRPSAPDEASPDPEASRPERPPGRLPRVTEEPALEGPARAEGERRARPLQARPDASAQTGLPAGPADKAGFVRETPGATGGPDGQAGPAATDTPSGDAKPPRRERPLRAPSRMPRPDSGGSTVPSPPARRPVVAPRVAERSSVPPRQPRDPSASRSDPSSPRDQARPPGPESPRFDRPGMSDPPLSGAERFGPARATGSAVAETEPARPPGPRRPQVVANNHGALADAPGPRRPVRARPIVVVDDLADDDLVFAQPIERTEADPITAPVAALDFLNQEFDDDPVAAYGAELDPSSDQVLIRAGQAGTPDAAGAAPAGPAGRDGDDRKGRRRLRRRGQDPS